MEDLMLESTREQDAVANAMAEQYGRCAVQLLESGDVLLTGMTDDVEMEMKRVDPDGNVVSAEHMRSKPTVIAGGKRMPVGYLVIRDGAVRPVNTMREAATSLRFALHADQPVRVRARMSLTRDRKLTAEETRQLLALAAGEAVTA